MDTKYMAQKQLKVKDIMNNTASYCRAMCEVYDLTDAWKANDKDADWIDGGKIIARFYEHDGGMETFGCDAEDVYNAYVTGITIDNNGVLILEVHR